MGGLPPALFDPLLHFSPLNSLSFDLHLTGIERTPKLGVFPATEHCSASREIMAKVTQPLWSSRRVWSSGWTRD